MSAPKAFNAVLMASSPWVTALRTVVTVTTTATALPTTALANRKGLYVYNPGTVNVLIAPSSDVATTNEQILFPKSGMFLSVSDAVTLYGIVASGTALVTVWEYTS